MPERIAPFTYRVASTRAGHGAHTVVVKSVVNLVAECDCEAAAHGKFCRHMAAAICEASRRFVTGAPAIQQPPAPVAPKLAPVSPAAFAARMAAA